MTTNKPFLWGAATSAFQIEGSAETGQRGPCIWDAYCDIPGKIADGGTGRQTCDHVRRYREDVALMKSLNLGAYRFSVSWPRVLPAGVGAINHSGLDFYDRLVDELIPSNIVPCVTLYHWDLPSALQDRLGGWEHPDTAKHFADFSTLIFDRLGDRVKLWITINEPWCIAYGGYVGGMFAPGIQDRARGFQVGHQLLRAHALTVAAFRNHKHNDGAIGIGLNSDYFFPASDSKEDREAAERALLDMAGWFGDPVWFGDYPEIMRSAYGDLLPTFSEEDQQLLRKSGDFIATNYYFSDLVRSAPGNGPLDYERIPYPDRPRTAMGWPIVPEGLESLLNWLSDRYGKLPVYITENGIAQSNETIENGCVHDPERIEYIRTHFDAARRAMDAGVDLRGFFVWSLLDNLEWAHGFTKRFGLVHCDFETQVRTIKDSGLWYAEWIANGGWNRDALPQPNLSCPGGERK
ncbi:MAG: beta-glucosidase [Phycisphaerae bacterium]|nr:MAG: beta-glucosidase [Phycisphaerae bacterium]